jgi:2-polyprenyl-3-methyl-5-hydroxy-6-metoxy-1,4-benzoquinol methylase
MNVTVTALDAFVAEVDRQGGPGPASSTLPWREFRYQPTAQVDTTLDPDSQAYFDQMLALYEELAGRGLDQNVTELTELDPGRLVPLESPYADVAPVDRTLHYLRLARAIRTAQLPKGARVLDMGCGWGLSSEFLAQLGLLVDAVDINELFVDLVRRRAARLGLPIRVSRAAFEDYEAEPDSLDAVLFYECFHHAVRPADLLQRIRPWLKSGARLILVGEPIQQDHWPNWGLRLDPLSVYCIRKFGWFESGWSARYLQHIVSRSGLVPVLHTDPDPAIGTFLIGLNRSVLDANQLSAVVDAREWWAEPEYLVSGRGGAQSTLSLFTPLGLKAIRFEIFSFRREPQRLKIGAGNAAVETSLKSGRNEVRLPLQRETQTTDLRLVFSCDTWCPDKLLGNGDKRQLGFHLRQISFE